MTFYFSFKADKNVIFYQLRQFRSKHFQVHYTVLYLNLIFYFLENVFHVLLLHSKFKTLFFYTSYSFLNKSTTLEKISQLQYRSSLNSFYLATILSKVSFLKHVLEIILLVTFFVELRCHKLFVTIYEIVARHAIS